MHAWICSRGVACAALEEWHTQEAAHVFDTLFFFYQTSSSRSFHIKKKSGKKNERSLPGSSK
jgi:hypothetical protein